MQEGPARPQARQAGVPARSRRRSAQALLFEVSADDIVIAAVPDTPVFRRLAEAWRERPLVRRAGIKIVLVSRDNVVSGLDL